MKADYEHNNLKLKIPPHYIVGMKEYVPITDERAFLVKIQFQQKMQCKKNLPAKILFSVHKLGDALSTFQFSPWKIQGGVVVRGRHAQSGVVYPSLIRENNFLSDELSSSVDICFASDPGAAAWMLSHLFFFPSPISRRSSLGRCTGAALCVTHATTKPSRGKRCPVSPNTMLEFDFASIH